MTSTARPQPAMTHQPVRAAATKPAPIVPGSAPLTAEPIAATPSAAPTCRLVEATAAATPACDVGMPETAVLVIGALTMPNPIPNSAYDASSQPYGVVAST